MLFRALFERRLRSHAGKLLEELFPQGYAGELFLCGGAFKPLLKEGLPINDLDLWVRNRREREKLSAALVDRGAQLINDFQPFCMKFQLEGRNLEITYDNVNDRTLPEVLDTFDLALSSMGVRYANGRVVQVCVSPECWQAVRHKRVAVLNSYVAALFNKRGPSLLNCLHRIGQQAAELKYHTNPADEKILWNIYWNDFTDDQRSVALKLFQETVIDYKGQCDEALMHRALHKPVPL